MSAVDGRDDLNVTPRVPNQLAVAAAMAQRVLDLEALVNDQSATIADLTGRLRDAGSRLGRAWDPGTAPELGLARAVRHSRCRGR